MTLSRTVHGPLVMVVMARVLGACGGEPPPSLPATQWESWGVQGGGASGLGAADPRPAATPTPPAAGADAWRGRAEAFRGDLGDVRSFGATGATVEGSEGPSVTTVRLDAESPSESSWAMARLRVAGSLRHPLIQPGARLVFDAASPASGSLAVTAVGCSGPRRDSAAFDLPAARVTMDVSAGAVAGTQRIDFTATFASPAGPQLVAGAFVYDPR
jgi:hypothetical protein